MYCGECGHQNSDAARYCSRCGALIAIDDTDGQATASFEAVDAEGPQETRESVDGPTLVIRAGGGRAGEQMPVTADRETIGRSPDSTLFLDDVTVSREHALLERHPDGLYIVDRASLNGTYVNRVRVSRHRLHDGDEVQVGKFKLTFLER